MKKTSLYEAHLKAGGKIVNFTGWALPVQYSSVLEEHRATRKNAALFDVSHMGEIIVKGKGAERFFKKLIPTSIDRLKIGKGMYTCFCNDHGGVIDDLFIFKLKEDEFYLVVNASTKDKDLTWLQDNEIEGVEIIDVSEKTSKIDLQGPKSLQILKKIINSDGLNDLKRFYFRQEKFKNEEVMISCTGYTGEIGYELFCSNKIAPFLWNELLATGESFGLKPAGLGARDILRLEACYSLYGHELADEISPIEAGLKWLVNSKDSYIGEKVLKQQIKEGVQINLVCLKVIGRGIPREDYQVQKDGVTLGYITSGGFSPSLKKGIALAYLTNRSVEIGDKVDIIIREKAVQALVAPRPFYKSKDI